MGLKVSFLQFNTVGQGTKRQAPGKIRAGKLCFTQRDILPHLVDRIPPYTLHPAFYLDPFLLATPNEKEKERRINLISKIKI